jgi:hypothetical protein
MWRSGVESARPWVAASWAAPSPDLRKTKESSIAVRGHLPRLAAFGRVCHQKRHPKRKTPGIQSGPSLKGLPVLHSHIHHVRPGFEFRARFSNPAASRSANAYKSAGTRTKKDPHRGPF